MPEPPYRISLQSQRKGGRARALALSPFRRRQIAREAAIARWSRYKAMTKPKKGKNGKPV